MAAAVLFGQMECVPKLAAAHRPAVQQAIRLQMPGAALHTAATASRAAVAMRAQLWRCVRANWAAFYNARRLRARPCQEALAFETPREDYYYE